MKRDLVVGIVGTAILVLAMVGVFRFEAAHGGGSAFRVQFATAEEDGPSLSGQLPVGQAATHDLALATPNATRVRFVLAWTDAIGDPDTFNLTVTSPRGETRTDEGSAGTLEVVFEDLAVVPPEQHILAASQPEAEARTSRDLTSRAAQGNWTVVVKLVSAPGLSPPVGGVEVQPDQENDWALGTRITAYRASFSPG